MKKRSREPQRQAPAAKDGPLLGSHLSVAGGLHNALLEAQRLGMRCVQVFTKNQRQWKAPPLTGAQVRLWNEHRRGTGVAHVVSHDSYLINLANPEDRKRRDSAAAFRDELLRCEALGIAYLVTHPGAHLGAGEASGLKLVAESLSELHRDLPGLKVLTCLEVTAGQGTGLGYRFEHLRQIIDATHQPERLAVCLDTAHLIEAGYDLTTGSGMADVLHECDTVIGLKLVRVAHLNDSKTPRGSRVDRHEHIGLGHVSKDAFSTLLRHEHFRTALPCILETPKEDAPDGRPWDLHNMALLNELAQRTS